MKKFWLWNNTDMRRGLGTDDEAKARLIWGQIKPRQDAGNAYAARFEVLCDDCGEYRDATVDHMTCRCGVYNTTNPGRRQSGHRVEHLAAEIAALPAGSYRLYTADAD